MVAAICITGIFIYFFIWSRKLKKNQVEEWRSLGEEAEQETIQGKITHQLTQKKRFFEHYQYIEIEAKLYIEEQRQTVKLIWKKPFTNQLIIPALRQQDTVLVSGNSRSGVFYANRITTIDKYRKDA